MRMPYVVFKKDEGNPRSNRRRGFAPAQSERPYATPGRIAATRSGDDRIVSETCQYFPTAVIGRDGYAQIEVIICGCQAALEA